MKVSLRTVEKLIGVKLPSVDELVAKINAQLGAIEEVIDLGVKYEDATIVKVVSCEKHPDADKLSICLVDDGGMRQDVPRNEDGLVQVVCGAPNVYADMWAVWLPPKSTVPASFDDDEPFVLDARKLRGVLSQGMLAAGDELEINSDHDGIIEITQDDIPHGERLYEGASFAEVFGLNDTIIDIENKMFTHRPDLFGQLGVARELQAILQPEVTDRHAEQHILAEEWFWGIPQFTTAKGLDITIFNDASENVPRFMTVAMSNVVVKPSPLWLQVELVRLGSKPINNVVDLTNYIMLLTAQPTHAYDYDRVRGRTLGVRMAHQGETIKLLNNKTYELNESDIVIADAEGAIGLAGIMGGSNSEVSSKTTSIVLEVGTFDMYAVRRSSMRHGVFTDALTRFNKGQSPLQNDRVIARLMSLLHDLSGAEQASDVFDDSFTEQTDKTSLRGELTIPLGFINDRLGLELTAVQVGNLLRGANFAVFSAGSENILSVTAPFWRTDIELPEDIVEEVGRLYGFDRLPRELPLRSTQPAPRNASRELAETVRRALARAGANEVLTYSFVHARVLEAAGQNPDDAYRLSNALSPDLQYYRLSVTPSLLDKVNANIRAGHNEFSLFEIGKSHSKKAGVDESGLPVEPGRIAFVYAAKKSHEGAPYFHAKKALDFLASEMGLELVYKSLPAGTTLTAAAPFAGGRTARVVDLRSGQAIGIIGEYALSVRKAFKLPDYAAGFELFTEGVMLACGATENQYVPLSRYPSVERDICFAVESSVTYGDVMAHIQKALTATEVSGVAEPVDIYQAEGERRRITVRIRITPHDQTMTGEAANACIDTISEYVVQRTGALII